MKYIYNIKGVIAIVLILFCSACNDDFLERYPLDAVSDAAYWTSEGDFENYMNQFYSLFPSKTNYAAKYDWEIGSDNIIGDGEGAAQVPGKIFRNSSDASLTDGSWNSIYDWSRKINYFLEKKDNVPEDKLTIIGKHYIGEAYFFRAWIYYTGLKRFGGVPYFDKVLTDTDEDLYSPRLNRYDLAKKIMADMDLAIENLQWKGNGPAGVSGRITKEAALGYKAQMALFEGSWEHYHQGSDFGVDGKDGSDFLKMAHEAAKTLMDKMGSSVYKGDAGSEYRSLFNKDNYAGISSVLHYRHYLPDDGVGHRWNNYYGESGGSIGLTKSLVDDYLMADGTPKELSGDYQGDEFLVDLLQDRDPRLIQSTYNPNEGTIQDVQEKPGSDYKMPTMTGTYVCPTGYWVHKGYAPQDAAYQGGKAGSGLIYLRYAEVLLAYAEAKAILEILLQSDIDISINVLRDRIGMGAMDLNTLAAWEGNAEYVKIYQGESVVINEIRRERRVELALEGQRYDDLRRWAQLDLVNNWVPRGVKMQQFFDYAASPEGIEAGLDSKITPSNFEVDSQGYLLALGKLGDFGEGDIGFRISESRDYLWSVPVAEITLYKEKGDVVLTQNPGWN